jgi:hypothetical protein
MLSFKSEGESRGRRDRAPGGQLENLLGKPYPSYGLGVYLTRHLAEKPDRKIPLEETKSIGLPAEPRQWYNGDVLINEISALVRYKANFKVPNACSKPGRMPSSRVDDPMSIPSASQNEGDKSFAGEDL